MIAVPDARGHFEALALSRMASGRLCLDLTARAGWDDLPRVAAALQHACGAAVLNHADGLDVRVWTVRVYGTDVRLVFDAVAQMVSLEAKDALGDDALLRVHTALSAASSAAYGPEPRPAGE